MSLARDLYKTKLCTLYLQRGHCPRQSCSFAHGEVELRKFPGRYGSSGAGDLRERLDRRKSPLTYRRRSPGRDDRGCDFHHTRKSHAHDRGRSHSRSPTKHKRTRSLSAPRSPAYMKREKKSLRSDATDTHISDVSGDGHEGDYAAANLIVSRRSPSPSIREALEEQVREVEAEKMALQVQKAKLELLLQKKIQETTMLSEKVEMLEARVASAEEECRGLQSKTKKFLKVYTRLTRAQEELKRAQARMVKLVEVEVGASNLVKVLPEMEDFDMNMTSDLELTKRKNLCKLGNRVGEDSGTQHKENVLHNNSSPVLQNEDTTSGEPQQQNNLAAIRRKALMQRELQQNGINMRAVNGADGNQTDGKVSTPGNKEEIFTEELRTNTQAKSLDSTPSPRACQVKEKPDLKSEEKAMDDGSSSDGANDGGDSDTNNGPVQD
ncbi:unnamed protein product [Sphagnum troendelagicum]